MKSALFATWGLGLLASAACGSSPPPTPSRSVDLGSGVTATLYADGRMEIRRQGQLLLGTASGKPLFSRELDPVNPDGFHDARKVDPSTLTAIVDGAIAMDSPGPGVLHLSTVDDGMPAALVSVAIAADAGFYTGLGERYDHVDARGQVVGMQLEIDGNSESGTTDRHVPVPWIVSSSGYGVFVKDREAGAWDIAAGDPGVVRATFEGHTLDVSIVIDPDPLAVVATLTTMTGRQRQTALWALSPMMWRHVDSQAELLSDLAHIRSLHLPTSAFWIDDGWEIARNSFDFDPAKYTDTTALAATMSGLGFELLGWSSPYLENPTSLPGDAAQQLYAEAKAHGYFVEVAEGAPFSAPGPDAKNGFGMIDFTNTAARAFWAGLAGKAVKVGMNGFKLDYGEDLIPDLLGGRLHLKLSDGESERTARNYPLGYHGAYRDALARTSDHGVLVVRASTYGGASVADIVWPGDLDNGFEHAGDLDASGSRLVGGLPASIVAAETLAASGFSLYGADIAGYRHGMPTKEALLRWAEHGALSMVMQLGPGENKYPWNFDVETVTIYARLASLHQKLWPYLASLLTDAETSGTPAIRPLPLAFPGDADAPAAADDEYLLGPALLAAPVVTPGKTSRQVHLPPGIWFSFWDGSRVSGPASLSAPAPLGQPPLYALAGSLVPMLPDGIDTVIPATDASTVSKDAMAGLAEAVGWVRGPAEARFPDGSSVAVTDTTGGVDVRWAPAGGGRVLTMALELSARTGSLGPLTVVSARSGPALAASVSESGARNASGSAYYLAGDRAVLRLDGASDVQIH